MIEALERLACALGRELHRESDLFWIVVDDGAPVKRSALGMLAALAYMAWWRDDRDVLRETVGFTGPVSDLAEGPQADALRWLAGQGPAVVRLPKRERAART